METRSINQIKIWKLMLNRMTGKAEQVDIVAMSTDRQKLSEFYESKKVGIYKDDIWNKQFEKGSLIEWFNDTTWDQDMFQYEWISEEQFYGSFQDDERFIDG